MTASRMGSSRMRHQCTDRRRPVAKIEHTCLRVTRALSSFQAKEDLVGLRLCAECDNIAIPPLTCLSRLIPISLSHVQPLSAAHGDDKRGTALSSSALFYPHLLLETSSPS